MWDNICTIHNAVADYRPDEHRLIKRGQVMADRILRSDKANGAEARSFGHARGLHRPGANETETQGGRFRMFYTAEQGYGALPFDPFKAIVAPRPIGWISTVDIEGRPNLAPYSFFNAVSSRPNMIGFSSEGYKHSARNAREMREFVFNLATLDLLEQMNRTSADVAYGRNEFEFAKLEMAPCRLVKPPRVAAAAAALECKLISCTELADLDGRPTDRWWVVGQVVATHIDDRFLEDGRFDTAGARPLGRCGYNDYTAVHDIFELLRPTGQGR